MPRLVNQAKIEKVAELFNEKIVIPTKAGGGEMYYDVYDWNWYHVAAGFFIASGLDVFEIDRAYEICRERKYTWESGGIG